MSFGGLYHWNIDDKNETLVLKGSSLKSRKAVFFPTLDKGAWIYEPDANMVTITRGDAIYNFKVAEDGVSLLSL